MKTLITFATAATLALAAGSAIAADKQFQFKVPVSFEMVPRQDVSGSRVHCAVYSDAAMTEASLVGQGRSSDGLSGFTDANKAKSTHTFYANFDADAGKDPTTAAHYQCWLMLENGGNKCRPDDGADGKPQWCTSNSDSDTLVVSGSF